MSVDNTAAKIDLSIIVPVYNATRHIERCVENVQAFNAIYSAMEAIFIDDASEDGSYELLQKLARTETYIKVSRLEANGGPGMARNRGIEMARGEHLFFLDVDDGFVPEKLIQLIAFAKKSDQDIIPFNGDILNVSGAIGERTDLHKVRLDRDARVRSFLRSEMDGSVIFTLFKKAFFTDHSISFPSGIHEDLPVLFKAYYLTEKIDVFEDRVYLKNSDPDSIVHTITKAHVSGIFNAYLGMLDFLKTKSFPVDQYGADIRYGVAGDVANLLLKIVFSNLSLEEKSGLAAFVASQIKTHEWMFFGTFDNNTQKDQVVFQFVEIFRRRDVYEPISTYESFEDKIKTMINPQDLSPVIAHNAQRTNEEA